MTERIAGYDMAPVTKETFLASLSRVLGADDASTRWAQACKMVSVNEDLDEIAADDLLSIAKAFVEMGGLTSVVGSSMYVRLVTYRTLSRKAPAGTTQETNQ